MAGDDTDDTDDPGGDAVDPTSGTTAGADAFPPVVAELPALHDLLSVARQVDELALQLVERCSVAIDDPTIAAVTGQPVDAWLAFEARQTGLDRRLLLRAARLLDRLPALSRAVRDRALSWTQLRGVTLQLHGLPRELDDEVDVFLAGAIPALVGTDPDTLVTQVRRAVAELEAERRTRLASADTDDVPRNRLTLQPRLDGSGGELHGELDAVGLAIVDAATAPTRSQLSHEGGVSAARADNLVRRLAQPTRPAPTRPPVRLLLRMELDALLGERALPADLLTTLVGGRLTLASDQAQQVLDAHGASLRTVVVDGGRVLGVGRSTRVPPGWLREVLSAVHDTCSSPGCSRSARTCDADHAVPWLPDSDDTAGGTTDVTNLAPLCPSTNRDKEAAGWTAEQDDEGARRWHHLRSGIRVRTVPATWRPPGWRGRRRRAREGPPPAPPPTTGAGGGASAEDDPF
jgi:hypothetical protein